MGADITFYDKKGKSYYFRDSYNMSNLAWVVDLSYWGIGDIITHDDIEMDGKKKEMFVEISKITDKQIENHVKNLKECPDKDKVALIKLLKDKRDDLIAHIDIIKNAVSIGWSV